jgi:hypothetical protein
MPPLEPPPNQDVARCEHNDKRQHVVSRILLTQIHHLLSQPLALGRIQTPFLLKSDVCWLYLGEACVVYTVKA